MTTLNEPYELTLDSLRNIRHTEITTQRIITMLLHLVETVSELQTRIRDLEKAKDTQEVIKVNMKYGAKRKDNDSHSIDQTT